VGALEVTVNVQAFRELQRVLANVPVGEFNIAHWNDCACGHARRDAWFQNQGFTSCHSFVDAAAFFGITRKEARQHARRQAVINALLKPANRAAAMAKTAAAVVLLANVPVTGGATGSAPMDIVGEAGAYTSLDARLSGFLGAWP